MRVIFLGTPSFGVPVLEALHTAHQVVGVVTQPDRVNARGKKALPSPVKAAAEALGLPVYQFDRLKEGLDTLEALQADIWVTAAYGQILNERALSIAPHGVWNVHASLLPRYRGASPVQCALMNGEKETGVTVMRTVRAVDAGDIVAQAVLPLQGEETAGEVLDSLSRLGAEVLLAALDRLAHDEVRYVSQNVAEATFCTLLNKEQGYLHFTSETAEEIKNRVRGLTPSPSAYFFGPHGRVKVFRARVSEECGQAGTVIATGDKIQVACTQGSVIFEDVQGENARRMTAAEYLRGKPIPVGTVLS